MAFRVPKVPDARELPGLRQLADHLLARREVLLKHWMEAVLAEPKITATDTITELQLRDH